MTAQHQTPETISQGNLVVAMPPVPRVRPIWPWGIGVLLAAVIGGFLYTQFWMETVPVVAVEVAQRTPVTRILGVNGRIAAVHEVDVQSQVTGDIAEIGVAEGETVAVDQVLVRIAAQAQSAVVKQAVAGLDAAIVAQQKASQDYDRAVLLGDNVTRTARATAASALESAEQEVARHRAVLEQAQVVLENYTVRAPIVGRVLSLDAEVGQIVSTATPLLTLVDVSDVIVEADVDEAYATQIALDQAAVLQLAGETETRAGHVSFVSTRVDVNTGGLAIELAFDAPVKAPIGLTVTANIVVDARDAALTIPRSAMVEGRVFLVQNGIAVSRPVSVIEWPAARLIVTDGLDAGDIVLVDGAGVTGGQAVRVEYP